MSSELTNTAEEVEGQDAAEDEVPSEEKSTIERIQEFFVSVEGIQDLFSNVVRPLLDATQRLYNDYGSETTEDLFDVLEASSEKQTITLDKRTSDNPPGKLEISAPSEVLPLQNPQLSNRNPNSKMEPKEKDGKWETSEKSKERIYFSVPCRYSTCGCREMVHPGSASEVNHMKSCDFRPIPCCVDGCGEDVPYHSFLIHLNQHFVYPTYGTKLTASVVIRAEDFETGGIWGPKWLSTQNRHFFLMLKRFESSGLWASWVCMLGNASGAEQFVCKITCFKGTKCISGVYPVHSIRRNPEELVNAEKNLCLLTSDAMIKTVVRMGKTLVSDMTLHAKIFPRDELEILKAEATCCKDLATIPDPSDIISKTLDSAMNKISTSVKSTIADISSSVNSALPDISSSVNSTIADISSSVNSVIPDISSSVNSAIAEISTFVTSISTKLGTFSESDIETEPF